VDEVHARFAQRGLACATIGSVDASREVVLTQQGDSALLWNFRESAFIGAPVGEPK
jgi:hydrogenase maturation factor HypE